MILIVTAAVFYLSAMLFNFSVADESYFDSTSTQNGKIGTNWLSCIDVPLNTNQPINQSNSLTVLRFISIPTLFKWSTTAFLLNPAMAYNYSHNV